MKISSLNNIGFCKKIPIKECRILDKTQNKTIPATVYEYDCTDLFDVYEVQKLDKNFSFKELFISGMHKKFINQKIGSKTTGHYYSLQKNNGEILGLCHTTEENDIDVSLLSSRNRRNYKYVGQNILSALAQKTLNQNGEELKISGILEEAEDYYGKVCGFERRMNGEIEPYPTYHLSKKEIPDFIKRIEEKTKST